jgi:hypothetical protein
LVATGLIFRHTNCFWNNIKKFYFRGLKFTNNGIK